MNTFQQLFLFQIQSDRHTGEVETGLDVVETILGLHEDQPDNPLGGGPSRQVTINSVTIE